MDQQKRDGIDLNQMDEKGLVNIPNKFEFYMVLVNNVIYFLSKNIIKKL